MAQQIVERVSGSLERKSAKIAAEIEAIIGRTAGSLSRISFAFTRGEISLGEGLRLTTDHGRVIEFKTDRKADYEAHHAAEVVGGAITNDEVYPRD